MGADYTDPRMIMTSTACMCAVIQCMVVWLLLYGFCSLVLAFGVLLDDSIILQKLLYHKGIISILILLDEVKQRKRAPVFVFFCVP